MDRRQRTQTRGACAACFTSKRKCDRKIPKCTQCQKQKINCEPRIFRHWKGPDVNASSTRRTGRRRLSPGIRASVPRDSLNAELNSEDDNFGLEISSDSADQLSPLPQTSEIGKCQYGEILQWNNWNEVTSMEDLLNTDTDIQRGNTPSQEFLDMQVAPTDPITAFIGHNSFQGSSDNFCFSAELPSSLSIVNLESQLQHGRPRKMPSELLASIEKGFLWNHFVHRTLLDIFCYDFDHPSNPSPDENPFYTQLPGLAFDNRHVLSACLALSGSHYNNLQKSTVLDPLVATLFQEVEEEFCRIVTLGHANSVDDLLVGLCIALLLCTAQIRSGSRKLWKKYLKEVQPLLSWFNQAEPLAMGEHQKLVGSLIRGFQYLEIISGVSFRSAKDCSSMSLNQILDDYQSLGIEWLGTSPLIGNPALLVDPFLAFSPRLVAPLKRLGILIDAKAQLRQSKGDSCEKYEELESKTTSLEEDLLHAYETDIEKFRTGSPDAKELLYCNLAFHAAGHILFYARLRDLPSTAPIIRAKIKDVIAATRKIPLSSRTYAALAFPLFTAGCEAVDADDRREISEKLLGLRDLCLSDVIHMQLILQKIWELRDLAPNTSWILWISQVEDHFGECLLY